jgi:proline dehydrogenase
MRKNVSFHIYFPVPCSWVQNFITRWNFAWRAASRFIAGESALDAIFVIKGMNKRNINATLDQLGEHTTTSRDAIKATDEIINLLELLDLDQIQSNVSIKLTQIGLSLGEDLCRQNLVRILSRAKQLSNFIRIDMEDTPYTEKTLQILREQRSSGFDNVGIVLQSCLYRSLDDAQSLLESGVKIRLVKGAYKEPSSLAFPQKKKVDDNFDLITKLMIDYAKKFGSPEIEMNGRVPPIPALGTHDEKRIIFGIKHAETVGLPKHAIEFQMLYGIRRDLQEKLAKEGYPVRIYVPFGTHWFPYYMRRLAERPANVWFFLTNFFHA